MLLGGVLPPFRLLLLQPDPVTCLLLNGSKCATQPSITTDIDREGEGNRRNSKCVQLSKEGWCLLNADDQCNLIVWFQGLQCLQIKVMLGKWQPEIDLWQMPKTASTVPSVNPHCACIFCRRGVRQSVRGQISGALFDTKPGIINN